MSLFGTDSDGRLLGSDDEKRISPSRNQKDVSKFNLNLQNEEEQGLIDDDERTQRLLKIRELAFQVQDKSTALNKNLKQDTEMLERANQKVTRSLTGRTMKYLEVLVWRETTFGEF